MKPLNHFKFWIGPGLFREYCQLFSSLDAALVMLDRNECLNHVGLVPSGHAPWKPFLGRPAHETTPFRAEVTGRPWEVIELFTYKDGEKSETHLAAFTSPFDAFAFAELKTKTALDRGNDSDRYFVTLRGWTEDGRQPEVARMPANHLAELIKAKRRAERRKLFR